MRRSTASWKASMLPRGSSRVLAIQPQVEREVIAGAGGDTDERDVVLDGDGRHQRLRAVATGHAKAVGAAGDGITRELLEVEAMVEQYRLDAELLGPAEQPELLHLAAA